MSKPQPIAIFDSGIGGLTVLAALRQCLPGEDFVYLGDTARLPYGTKSPETVTRYTLRAAQTLAAFQPKMLVVACNTASSAALPDLQRAFTVPVLGVIEPGARAAAARTTGRVGVIGTESTVASGAYPRALQALRPSLEVLLQPCPLFVPLAEEGWFDHPVTREVARIYLEPLIAAGVDTLVLGCTHYPLLVPAIRAVVGEGVKLVDSGRAVAEEVVGRLEPAAKEAGSLRILVTDGAPRFLRLARFILGEGVTSLELVDLPA